MKQGKPEQSKLVAVIYSHKFTVYSPYEKYLPLGLLALVLLFFLQHKGNKKKANPFDVSVKTDF